MRYLLAVFLISTLSACESFFTLPWPGEDEALIICNSESPCPPEEHCSFGRCTDVRQGFRTVAIAVRDSDKVQQFLSVNLSQSTDQDVTLHSERSFSGQLRTDENKGIPAAVVARLQNSIEGHPVLREVQTDEEGNFELILTEGVVWELDIMPNSDQIPAPPRQILSQRISDTPVAIILPNGPDYPVYTGQLVDAEGRPLSSLRELRAPGVLNAQELSLAVLDAHGRHVGSNPTISENGSFQFKAHPDTEQVLLLLRGRSPWQPAAVSQLMNLNRDDTNLGPVMVPVVDGKSALSISLNHQDAAVTLRGEVTIKPLAAEGRVIHRLALPESAPLQVELAVGRYEIDILPVADSNFAASRGHKIDVRAGGSNALAVEIHPLLDLHGSVVTPDGSPAVSVRVVCRQAEGQVEALTDDSGNFEMKVQQGATWLTVIPAPPLPRALLDISLHGNQSLDIVLEEGIVLTGSLMLPLSRQTLGNVHIEVMAPWKTFDGQSVVLGQGVVNSDGMFSVSLPNLF
jgi:hypothetical protein